MMAKLTLSADREVIDKAKRLAAERGTSVSAMFSDYVTREAERAGKPPRELGPITRQALGLAKLRPEDQHKSYRQLRDEALAEKYGI